MDLSRPETALINRTDIAVLSVLSRSDSGLTGRHIAQLAALPHSTVAQALGRLAEIGVVHYREAGRAFLHTVNRDHLVWPTVEAALASRQLLYERYRELFEERPDVTLVVYGSVARGDAHADSDVDLLLLVPDGAAAEPLVDQVSAMTRLWTGHEAQVYDATYSELATLVRKRSPIVDSWLTEGTTVTGQPLAELIRDMDAA